MTNVDCFVERVLASPSQYAELDRIYVHNRVLALVGEGHSVTVAKPALIDLTTTLVETAIQNGKITATPSEREILTDQLMDLVTPLPSALNQTFWEQYQTSPVKATDYFYQLSRANDYIKTRAIAKNVVFNAATDFGELEITINLSKPEMDP